jgi:hypothetical protein
MGVEDLRHFLVEKEAGAPIGIARRVELGEPRLERRRSAPTTRARALRRSAAPSRSSLVTSMPTLTRFLRSSAQAR